MIFGLDKVEGHVKIQNIGGALNEKRFYIN